MKNSKILALAVIAGLVVFIAAGCTYKPGSSTQLSYAELEEKYNDLLHEQDTLTAENATLQAAIDGKEAELAAAQASYNELQASVGELQADKAELQSRYDNLSNDLALLQAARDEAEAELAEIREIYPPRHFTSGDELRTWLAQDDISTREMPTPVLVYRSALELQKRALQDGFLINVDITMVGSSPAYYVIWCSAVTEDKALYIWTLNSDNPNYFLHNIDDFQWAVGAG